MSTALLSSLTQAEDPFIPCLVICSGMQPTRPNPINANFLAPV